MARTTFCRKGGELPWTFYGVSLVTLALFACNGNDARKPWPNNPNAPLISTLSPADGATSVAPNVTPSAVFNTPMAPLSGTTFTLAQGMTPVAGAVTTSTDGLTATFTPSSPLVPSSVFTAMITTGAMSSTGANLAMNHSWTFTTAAAIPPVVNSTIPAANATAVALNSPIIATFSKVMDLSTITSTTFTLSHGGTLVPSSVVTGPGNTATLTPTSPLAASTIYTASLTTGVKDLQGNPLAAAAVWSFTSGTTTATTPPVVSSTTPAPNITGVGINTILTATFNEPMSASTITSSTFTLKQGNTPVLGTVAYGPGTSATFTPASPLASNVLFTATLSTAVQDVFGNALAGAYMWSFTTGTTTAMGPAVVNLGTAGNYAILAKTAISTVPGSAITGDIGLSPAAATYITGFSLVADSTNVFSRSTQIVGKAFASNYAVPTPSNLTTAVANMQTAYTDAAGRPTPDHLNLGSGNIGGLTLAPGLYNWTSTVTIPTDVVINGGANDVWIFQTSGDLSMSDAKNITLSGGAQAKNIFWQVAGQVTVGTGSHFEGILLCQTQVTLQTGATMNGRILAQTMVALQKATVTVPAP